MTSQLKRIEATLKQLNQKRNNSNSPELENKAVSETVNQTNKSQSDLCDLSDVFTVEKGSNSAPQKSRYSLSLPTFEVKNQSNSPRRYIINSALPMNLLKELQQKITQWQNSLTHIQKQIQEIYQEGPLLDGWLESSYHQSFSNDHQPRKAKQDHLMGYVEELVDQKISYQSPRQGYYLCGKDEMGKIWSQPCPADQVIEVTMAIARYQKLQQLLAQKKKIETRLSQLAEGLVILHSSLQQD